MNAQQWLASSDPQAMLTHVQGKAADRKLRLFACACCYQVWSLLTDERSPLAVEVASRYADGQATVGEMEAASLSALRAAQDQDWGHDAMAAWTCTNDPPTAAASGTLYHVTVNSLDQHLMRVQLAALLRCIVGNPWRPVTGYTTVRRWCQSARHLPPHAHPMIPDVPEYDEKRMPLPWLRDLLTWRSGLIPRLAQQAYGQRLSSGLLDPVRLAVLADAVEEAGCTQEDLLRHLRGWEGPAGLHARGCWCLDLLLNRE